MSLSPHLPYLLSSLASSCPKWVPSSFTAVILLHILYPLSSSNFDTCSSANLLTNEEEKIPETPSIPLRHPYPVAPLALLESTCALCFCFAAFRSFGERDNRSTGGRLSSVLLSHRPSSLS